MASKQLEHLADMLHEKMEREVEEAVRPILENLPPGHDPRDTAKRISEAVAKVLDRRKPRDYSIDVELN